MSRGVRTEGRGASVHVAAEVRELGHPRLDCAACGTPWPCPPRRIQIAQANDNFDPDEWVAEDVEEARR